MATREQIVFVTGKLAEPSLHRVLEDLAPKAGFDPQIIVMPITVAALLTTPWIARRINIPEGTNRVILPGLCRGELSALQSDKPWSVERGPDDLRDLPEYFGKSQRVKPVLDQHDIEIVAEINHAPSLSLDQIFTLARRYRDDGADIIDLGCDPGSTWSTIGNTVARLVNEGFHVSVDSLNVDEITPAIQAGARLVLSVNSSNIHECQRWKEINPHLEVVAIPDSPRDLDSLHRTVETLDTIGIRYRLDPILEPIGFGFAASLGRYLEVRRLYPEAEILMGIGNLTELTDADSAAINVILAGFCQELGIRSVLTTEVAPWARSSVREFNLARKLVYHSVRNQTLPKRLEPNLILLREPKNREMGTEALQELARKVTDRNYRIFAERGEIHLINGEFHIHGSDPFALFDQLLKLDKTLDPSHSFYLGYELSKAITALTLGKNYTQDQALRWGFLTRPEQSHRSTNDH